LVCHSSTIAMMHGPINIRFSIYKPNRRHAECRTALGKSVEWFAEGTRALPLLCERQCMVWHTDRKHLSHELRPGSGLTALVT